MQITKRLILIAVCSLNLAGPAAFAASTVYLGFSGQPTDVSQTQLTSDVEAKFTAPADAMKPDVMVYYNWQADGANRIVFGLIAQAVTADGSAKLAMYMSQLDHSSFHGMTVQFQNVERIDEAVTLLAGVHEAPTSDGGGESLDQNYQLEKKFTLKGLSDWETFNDKLGDAFLSKTSSDFQSYLAWFVDNSDQLATIESTVLAHDDTVVAVLNPTVVLSGGATVGSDSGTSPFFYETAGTRALKMGCAIVSRFGYGPALLRRFVAGSDKLKGFIGTPFIALSKGRFVHRCWYSRRKTKAFRTS
jgi:hypothetical protein